MDDPRLELLKYRPEDVKKELLLSSINCIERGLFKCASWCSDMASGIKQDVPGEMPLVPDGVPTHWSDLDAYTKTKSFFGLREYLRAAHHSEKLTCPAGRFLHFYSRYLAVEKQAMLSSFPKAANVDYSKSPLPKGLEDLMQDLTNIEQSLDGYCLYLLGVVRKRLKLKEEAFSCLLRSIFLEPCLWMAWQELVALVPLDTQPENLGLPSHWMRDLFSAAHALDTGQLETALKFYYALDGFGFSSCNYIDIQLATAFYNLKRLPQSADTFLLVRERDPYQMESMDTFSDVLFVQDAAKDLSLLAHTMNACDRYRPETCYIMGNLQSSYGNHDKAILYFRQAVKLNPNYESAWTLLGHEHLEMKQPSMACQAYHRAVELNAKDFRAWYGLGQTYELLLNPTLSCYYFKNSLTLRPDDSRILIAVGVAYQNMDRVQEAILCFEKAVRIGDPQGIATYKLASIYEETSQSKAAALYENYLAWADDSGLGTSEQMSSACSFLMKYSYQNNNMVAAASYAHRASLYSQTREEAWELIDQLNMHFRDSHHLLQTASLSVGVDDHEPSDIGTDNSMELTSSTAPE